MGITYRYKSHRNGLQASFQKQRGNGSSTIEDRQRSNVTPRILIWISTFHGELRGIIHSVFNAIKRGDIKTSRARQKKLGSNRYSPKWTTAIRKIRKASGS